MVGGIEAVLFVCTPIDAKSVKPGQEILQRAVEQRKLDLAAIRKSDAYRSTYNAEVNRLLALPPRTSERLPERLVKTRHPKHRDCRVRSRAGR